MEFAELWPDVEVELLAKYRVAAPSSYDGIFRDLVATIAELSDDYRKPDPSRIVDIDHGDYQGTQVFVVAESGYQPNAYWICKVSYGSCSGCDSFQAIRDSDWSRSWDDPPNEQQARDYVSLARHMLQGMQQV